MILRAKAPLRISFCGGGTDVSPYPEQRGGVVLSTTIDKYVYATLRTRSDRAVSLTSLDYDRTRSFPLDAPLPLDGDLDLLKGVVNHFRERLIARGPAACGFDLLVHSDAPPGSGLGSSSTLVTALVGLLRTWLREPLANYEIAEQSYRIERIDLAVPGGKQDPYAATFGGFNWIEFRRDHTIVNPLRIRRDVVNELEYSLILCYSGASRVSASIVESQTRSYVEGNPAVLQSLERMKELATEMKGALLRDRVRRFGDLLREAWIAKKALDPGMTNERIDRLHEAALGAGAVGGKLLGAGGGGFLLVFCPFERRQPVERALEVEGGRIVPFALEERGLQTWTVPPENEGSASDGERSSGEGP